MYLLIIITERLPHNFSNIASHTPTQLFQLAPHDATEQTKYNSYLVRSCQVVTSPICSPPAAYCMHFSLLKRINLSVLLMVLSTADTKYSYFLP